MNPAVQKLINDNLNSKDEEKKKLAKLADFLMTTTGDIVGGRLQLSIEAELRKIVNET